MSSSIEPRPDEGAAPTERAAEPEPGTPGAATGSPHRVLLWLVLPLVLVILWQFFFERGP
ncbi:MAG: hypothetical protein KF729_09890 [Sandaracinaceae bacterium]|nr:hypothetical protein [Sandaracinaceae bacterium]